MIQTLRLNFRDPDRRRYVGAKMGGKIIGVALVMGLIYGLAWYFSTEAGAAVPGQAAAVKVTEVVNGLNTAWVLVTAFLVFFMQAGFMMLEGGFARTREVANIMIECIVDTALCGVLFYAFGFAFMFGPGNGWIGYHYFFLQESRTRHVRHDRRRRSWRSSSSSSRSPTPLARSCRARWSGAPSFKGDLLYSLAVSGFIYPIFGHWIWGPNGWLATMEHAVPRLRRLDGGAHHRRRARPLRGDRARPAARAEVQA